MTISAPCRGGEKVRVRYEKVDLVRVLNAGGEHTFDLDCFLGAGPGITVIFKDETAVSTILKTLDLDRVTKVATVWRGPVNLDLHAFEYAANLTDKGHVWAGSPSSRWDVEEQIKSDRRGHGFISSASDGTSEGDQIEVYTFLQEPGQASGAIRLALDYESRARSPQDPDTCGTGLYAEVEYVVTVRYPTGRVTRTHGLFGQVPCDRNMDQVARYNSKTMPQLIFTR